MMKRACIGVTAVLLLVGSLHAHDMFLKFESHFLEPKTDVSIALYNGTFDASENVITRDRMQDVRIVGPGEEVTRPKSTQWRDSDETSWLDFKTGDPGTYVIGVSTRSRMIELSAEDFNGYLEHDGVLDALAARKAKGLLEKPARERYSKHVKAICQVGDTATDAYRTRLGYPIEIVPLDNPMALSVGEKLRVAVLRDGKPVASQLVYASHAGHHAHDEAGNHVEAVKARTNDKGVARIELSKAGRWYVRLIHMVESTEKDVDYESNWATLTFELK